MYQRVISPPAPMNHVKLFIGRARRFALLELVQVWYKIFPPDQNGTKYFHLTILVRWKSTTEQCWGIKPVPHNLVQRIKFWSLKSREQDFEYLFWRISSLLLWNTHANKGTYIIDWVGRERWMSRVSCMNESCFMYQWVVFHAWMSGVWCIHESCLMYQPVLSHDRQQDTQ